jgi:hypothetical protein
VTTTTGAKKGKDRKDVLKEKATGLTIELLIECGDETVARALDEALMPDNRYFPKDQRFKASRERSFIRFSIESPRARPALSTVASIISDTKLFRDFWVEAKTLGLGNAGGD